MAKKILIKQLYQKLADTSVPEEEIKKYFVLDADASRAFAPGLVINPDTVKAKES